MGTEQDQTGGCQCGAIRYRLNGEAKMLYACHCTDCQKQSSSAFGMSLIVDRKHLEITAGLDRLKSWGTRGDDGRMKHCAFCGDCGTRLYHGGETDAEPVSIKAGSLDDTRRLRPVAQIWLQSAQPWIDPDPALYRCYPREPDDEAELEVLWHAQNREA